MKLTALRLHNVRRFGGTGVRIEAIGDGINLLCAANEHGKSTCFDALHALFFQPHGGTPGAVQALRPYSGGSPLIEADVEVEGRVLRLTKQFYAGRKAQVRETAGNRLIAQADEAERLITGLVRGGTGGPAGLLWVRQGFTGIERRAKADDEAERRARETVLTSVQGEVEMLTGGRRMAETLAACEEELSRLVTATGRPKAGSAYAAALDEAAHWAEQELRLAAEVADLRSALDRRRAIRQRLREIDTPIKAQETEAALAEAETALADARSHAESRRMAESEAALAGNRRDMAAQALATFRQGLARLAELTERETAAIARRDEARTRHGEAVQAREAAALTVESAEREEREQRDLLFRLERALRAREAAERLVAFRQALAEALATRRTIEEGEATLRSLTLPAAKLAALEKAETDRVQQQASAEARAARLTVHYDAGAEGAITVGGAMAEAGQAVSLTGTTSILIRSVGRLTLALPEDHDGEALARAEQRRQSLLAELGVDSLAAARLRQTRSRDLDASLALARQRFALVAPQGLAALQEQIARLEAEIGVAGDVAGEPEELRRHLAALDERIGAGRASARSAQSRVESLAAALIEAESLVAGLTSSRVALSESLGPRSDWQAQEERLAAVYDTAERLSREAGDRLEQLSARQVDLAALAARQARLRSVAAALRQDIAQLREEAAGLEGRIQSRAEAAVEEQWLEAQERSAAAQRRVAAFARETAVLTRLRQALEAARSQAREHYFAPVMQELRPLLGLLFDDANVTFDEETLLPRSVLRAGLEEQVGVLSGGMREQLAILTRLAFARLLAREGQPTPVILDDALVYSDDDRIERMFDALHRQASTQQIIVFSCRQRAFAQLGGRALRMEPWQPET